MLELEPLLVSLFFSLSLVALAPQVESRGFGGMCCLSLLFCGDLSIERMAKRRGVMGDMCYAGGCCTGLSRLRVSGRGIFASLSPGGALSWGGTFRRWQVSLGAVSLAGCSEWGRSRAEQEGPGTAAVVG